MTVPLRRLAAVLNGGTPGPDGDNWDGDVPWATPTDLARVDGGVVAQTERTLTRKGLAGGSRTAPRGSVLLSTRAPIGYTSLVHAGTAFNQGCKAVVPAAQVLDSRFIQYWLGANRASLHELGSGSTFRELGNEPLLSFPVPVIELREQRRIADFLDDRVSRIDNIIAARRQQISVSAAAEIAAVRTKLAGVGIDGAQPLPSTIPWVSAFSSSTSPRRLARVLTLQRGADLTDGERVPGEFPVVTTAGVSGTHHRSIANGPGVVIGRYGSVGNVHWVDQDFWPHNTTLYVRETFGNDLRWCYYLLQAYPYAALQARAAIPGINRNDMAPEFVPWVDTNTQRRAASELDQMSADWASRSGELSDSIELLTEYKQSLITAAVTGELDVTTASTKVPV